jgi:hypothetical protein
MLLKAPDYFFVENPSCTVMRPWNPGIVKSRQFMAGRQILSSSPQMQTYPARISGKSAQIRNDRV